MFRNVFQLVNDLTVSLLGQDTRFRPLTSSRFKFGLFVESVATMQSEMGESEAVKCLWHAEFRME